MVSTDGRSISLKNLILLHGANALILLLPHLHASDLLPFLDPDRHLFLAPVDKPALPILILREPARRDDQGVGHMALRAPKRRILGVFCVGLPPESFGQVEALVRLLLAIPHLVCGSLRRLFSVLDRLRADHAKG